ncbi:MAG: hypothetical protein JNL61_07985 [Rhizobiaceae bacterium]|nr:hypothetical protein [Rhizobiaceae bacterium]
MASAIAAVVSIIPSSAFAHAADRGHVLLLPTGHYLAAGAAAVAASFLLLGFVRPGTLRAVLDRRLRLPFGLPGVRLLLSLISFALTMLLVAAGFFGSRDPLSNPLPLFFWTLLWVGLTLAQGALGNLWAAINPWYGPCRLVRPFVGTPALRLPRRTGYWPAVLGLAGMAWFELIDLAPDDPSRLATVVLAYWLTTFAGIALFGYVRWLGRCEFLSAFLGMVARFGIVDAGGRRLALCFPGARLQSVAPLPLSGTLLILLALASVTFDGLSRTFFWLGLNGINPLDFPGRSAMTVINSLGLAGAFVALAAAFLMAVWAGLRLSADPTPPLRAAGLLVWSLVPIALGYLFAHYLTLLLVNGQYALVAMSDPFSLGWNLFGTAHWNVEAGIVMGHEAAWVIWNLQSGAIILAHVVAVSVAHALADRLRPADGRLLAGQLPLGILMVLYTVMGLWLLSSPTGA